MKQNIIILGGGPAGMIAALHAARSGQQVCLVEANPRVGKKLLVTGSGRANLTNQSVCAEKYACTTPDPAWLETLFAQFGPHELRAYLEEIGIFTFATSDGWVYPISESAQTVVSAFESALKQSGVQVLTDHRVTTIRKSINGFSLSFQNHPELECSRLLVATGGKAYPTLGSTGDCFPWLKKLGHTLLPLLPALGPLSADMNGLQRLQGIRLDATVHLYKDQQLVEETTGNLIFTEWGLNGPAVMDLSHHVARNPQAGWNLTLNFLPTLEVEIRQRIQKERRSALPLGVLPGCSLPPKMAALCLERAGLDPETPLANCSDAQLKRLLELITAFPLRHLEVRGFDTCQVSAGGVPLVEVDPKTMQSRRVPGLFLAGETLDVVGPCGGYNLQFAFSTGAVAGMSITK